MGMRFGDNLRVTLFGESHGSCVGALVEGMPAGTEIDETELSEAILKRRPGRKNLSTRSESEMTLCAGSMNRNHTAGGQRKCMTRDR